MSSIAAVLAIFFLLPVAGFSQVRSSSAPFISGDGFRAHCDYRFDETGNTINARDFQEGSSIFVKTDMLDTFFASMHPRIPAPYVLVTHNSDHPAPGPFADYLEDPKILAWFGQNVEGAPHPKLHNIPIGIANQYWGHGNPSVLRQAIQKTKKSAKPIFLYMNFAKETYPTERTFVANLFKNSSFCTTSGKVSFYNYLLHMGNSSFVLSPRGNGLDCHRTWEALYLGAIPIVRTSSLDPLFENLPVLVIDEWQSLNLPYLQEQQRKIRLQNWNLEKIYLDYWLKKIDSYKPIK